MKTKRNKYIIIFLFFLFPFIGTAQEDEVTPSLKLIARAYPDSVVLRWAPNTPVAWTYANKFGYLLEKYLLLKDGELIENPMRITLSHTAIKPLPLEHWEAQVEKDDYAAIAAQAIYGETFELTEDYSSDIVQVIHKARELESRFSFALFAADLSPWVAKASGLKFIDTDVKKGEKYLYRVYTAVPETMEKIDTGFIYLGVDDYQELPKPLYLKGEFADRTVLLSWNRSYFEDIYIAYQVERSDDGCKTFQSIEDLPLVNTQPGNKKASELMFKMDSLPQNYKKFYYRVRGFNAFGELGPPSDTISGMGIEELGTFPVIDSARVSDNQTVILSWSFSEKFNIKGFHIERTGNPNRPFNRITQTLINPEARTFEDTSPLASNYYKIKAIGEYKQEAESYPYMVQLPDSIPPEAPVGLTGEVDTSGVVTLTWEPNNEPDLLGYRVYRSNFEEEEFVQITNAAVKSITYTDTINVKTLTKKIFYKIIAVDIRENPSDFSEVLQLKRPDVIPPVQPIFTKVRSENEGILLEWVNSSSADIAKHLLYRKEAGDKSWELISIFYIQDSISAHIDKQIEKGKKYEYTLVAVDDSNLESKPSKPVIMANIDTGIKPGIEKIFAKADKANKQIVLNWNYSYDGVGRYLIFRAKSDQPLKSYKAISAAETKFTDTALEINTTYKYRVKAEYKNGTQSPFSKELVVKY